MTHQNASRSVYAFLCVGMILFTLYGSYVPFDYKPRPWGDAWSAYRWALDQRMMPDSRADFAANLALGIPLGFTLLGAIRGERPNRAIATILAIFCWPACVAFAAMVEFLQLFFPLRTCAGSDVLAQSAGSALGFGAWILLGPQFTTKVRRRIEHPDVDPRMLRWLGLAWVGMALAQWLPLDLTASPYDLKRRFFDPRITTLMPFDDLRQKPMAAPVDEWKKGPGLGGNPGSDTAHRADASQLGGRWSKPIAFPQIATFAGVSGLTITAGHLFVTSRHPSSTDILWHTLGLLLGWWIGQLLTRRRWQAYRLEIGLFCGQFWLMLLGFIHWQPFEFRPLRLLIAWLI